MAGISEDRDLRLSLVERDVDGIKRAISEIRDSTKEISKSLQLLAVLEQRHAETRDGLERAFIQLLDHETRLRNIEAEMPTMKMARGWTITGVIGIVGLVGLAAWKVFVSA